MKRKNKTVRRMEEEKGKDKTRDRDRKPLIAARVLAASLPLILKLILVFLRYKRSAKKKRKVFRKTLEKEGLNKEVVEKLVEDLPVLSVRDLLSKSMDGGGGNIDRRWP